MLDVGLRVNHIGKSSVAYEVGVFREGSAKPAAVGGYTHVFVNSMSRKACQMRDQTREGLLRLVVEVDRNNRLEPKL